MTTPRFSPERPARGARLGRRTVLGAGLLTALAGCSEDVAPGAQPTARATTPIVGDSGPIIWGNWPDYLDRAKGKHPSLEAFMAESGIRVDYQTPINDNAQFLADIAGGLEAGTSVGYDIITPTTWAAAQLVRRGQVQPFGPVASDRVISALAAPAWDPEQRFSMPWQAGLTGIAYDARKVERAIGSVSELFERPDLAGGVGLLTEWSDTLGLALLSQGRDLRDLSEDMIAEGLDYVRARDEAGQIKGYYGNNFMDALSKGELIATMAWSGDVLQAQLENPYLKFVVPEEGLMIWSDCLLVPMGSSQAGAVAKLAEFYYRPEVAAEVAAWVNYICPVVGAQEAMETIAPELANNPLIFPDQTILDQSYLFPALPDALNDRMQEGFDALL